MSAPLDTAYQNCLKALNAFRNDNIGHSKQGLQICTAKLSECQRRIQEINQQKPVLEQQVAACKAKQASQLPPELIYIGAFAVGIIIGRS